MMPTEISSHFMHMLFRQGGISLELCLDLATIVRSPQWVEPLIMDEKGLGNRDKKIKNVMEQLAEKRAENNRFLGALKS